MPKSFIDDICTENQCLALPETSIEDDNTVNLTTVALELANYCNAVSEKHQEVTQHMFPDHEVDFITNGIHVSTWASPSMQTLFDTYTPRWRTNPELLRHVQAIPAQEVAQAHQTSRQNLHTYIAEIPGIDCIPNAFTIGFARRATAYKRAQLLLSNPEHLLSLAHRKGGLNIIFAGKAYYDDSYGRELIKSILDMSRQYSDSRLRIIYLENYNMDMASYLISGVDIWLNTPKMNHEASGTSGMKAALNGIPNISVNDGWWIEGGISGVNGWTIDGFSEEAEVDSLHHHLETALSLYYYDPQTWAEYQRASISLIASYFNTHRMVTEYIYKGYNI
jgi:starch phosphorylase